MSNRLRLLREGGATRPRRTVAVLLDGEVREQIEAVEDELDRLDEAPTQGRRLNTRSADARRDELVAELTRLRESAEESTLYVVLEAMQRTPYRVLVADHPPRRNEAGEVVDMDRLSGVNAETFGEAIVRACVIGYRERPEADAPVLDMPAEDLDRLIGFVTPRQMDALSSAATRLCVGDDAVPLPRRRSPTPTSDEG